MPDMDERDHQILAKRQALRNKKKNPRIGDYCLLLDGTLRRFTHNWGDSIQTTPEKQEGSFYLSDEGLADYSGGLDRSIPLSRFILTKETKKGNFWFFHHNEYKAHNGVYFELDCRVYQQIENNDG